jgi:hypothetical protein
MKKLNHFIALGLVSFAFACSNDNKPDNAPPAEPVITQDNARVDSSVAGDPERDEYRMRINNRINEIEHNIEERRAMREAEKDVKKQKEYDVEIERNEKRKGEFKQKLDNFEARAKEGWANFKTELDELFTRDKEEVDKDDHNHNHDHK